MLIEKTKIYGVDKMGGENPTLERTDSAIDLTYEINGCEIRSDFSFCYPWSDMREICDDYGNVFVKIPKFYSKISENGDGTYKLQISGCRYDGFSTLFTDGKGGEIPYVLVGKYEGSLLNGAVRSISGASIYNSDTMANMRTLCQANGTGYQMYDIFIDAIIKQLFTVEFATTNSQSVMIGYSYETGVAIPGGTNLVGTSSGTQNEDGSLSCKYRGIENPWGNVATFCDGIRFQDKKMFICADPTAYSVDATYTCVGERLLTKSGYCTKTKTLEKFPLVMLPAESTSNDTPIEEYYCDYVSIGNGRAITGGCWGDKTKNGIWCFTSVAEGWSGSISKGCRLCYKPI